MQFIHYVKTDSETTLNLIEASRQGEIERRVEQVGLDLKVTNEPLYHIER